MHISSSLTGAKSRSIEYVAHLIESGSYFAYRVIEYKDISHFEKEKEMKVYEGLGPLFQQDNKGVNKKGENGSDFQQIMEGINSKTDPAEMKPGIEDIGPVDGGVRILHGAEQVGGSQKVDKELPFVSELQEILDLVDFYSSKLADSSISSSGLTPLISHLEDRIEGLRSMESSSETPEKLRSVISDMVITIGSEVAKFKRGDYQ